MELNSNPSLSYHEEKVVEDEDGKQTVKRSSELDKFVKVKIVNDTFKILIDGYDEKDSTFIKVHPTSEYKKYEIIDELRKIYEFIEGYKCPDYITLN